MRKKSLFLSGFMCLSESCRDSLEEPSEDFTETRGSWDSEARIHDTVLDSVYQDTENRGATEEALSYLTTLTAEKCREAYETAPELAIEEGWVDVHDEQELQGGLTEMGQWLLLETTVPFAPGSSVVAVCAYTFPDTHDPDVKEFAVQTQTTHYAKERPANVEAEVNWATSPGDYWGYNLFSVRIDPGDQNEIEGKLPRKAGPYFHACMAVRELNDPC